VTIHERSKITLNPGSSARPASAYVQLRHLGARSGLATPLVVDAYNQQSSYRRKNPRFHAGISINRERVGVRQGKDMRRRVESPKLVRHIFTLSSPSSARDGDENDENGREDADDGDGDH